MLHKPPPWKTPGRKVSPPQPTYMTAEQKSQYLADLRNNRPTRPGGSRPPPTKAASYAPSQSHSRSESVNESRPEREEEVENKRASIASFHSKSFAGRPLVQAPSNSAPSVRGRKVSPTATIQTAPQDSRHYLDSGARSFERRESHYLREALDKADRHGDEETLHQAAQDEATQLVWQHQNPQAAEAERDMPYQNPDLPMGITTQDFANTKSTAEELADLSIDNRRSAKWARAAETANRRRSSGKRTISNGSSKGVFRNPDDHIYEEPEPLDLLLVKAPMVPDTVPLQSRSRNSLPRGSRPLPQKADTMPILEKNRLDRFEIQRNPPSRSRNAAYTVNAPTPPSSREATPEIRLSGDGIEIRSDDLRAATSKSKKERSPKLPLPSAVSDRSGRPIVSFDPSWRPTCELPTMGGRELPLRPPASVPSMTFSAPVVPTINLPDEPMPPIPTIFVDDAPTVPSISISSDTDHPSISISPPTSTPQINNSSEITQPPPPPRRPLPTHAQSLPTVPPPKPTSRLPWLNSNPRNAALHTPTATCTSCLHPISGRILTASSDTSSDLSSTPTSSSSSPTKKSMFHPHCFTCAHCSTPLEHISFYPEPPTPHHHPSPDPSSSSTPRFYCHLDFHALFSPPCRSCQTPIESSTIVHACGHTYHAEHFYCAECGDPFGAETPFVEDAGYPYCVRCATRRGARRCAGCRERIIVSSGGGEEEEEGEGIEALGRSWHERCFRCVQCGEGIFGDRDRDDGVIPEGGGSGGGGGGQFFVREVEVPLTEKEKRRGMKKGKTEERAVCVSCEVGRLKA